MASSESDEADLIELWRENPCLYDITCKAYSNRNQKKKAIDDIADTLKMTADARLGHDWSVAVFRVITAPDQTQLDSTQS